MKQSTHNTMEQSTRYSKQQSTHYYKEQSTQNTIVFLYHWTICSCYGTDIYSEETSAKTTNFSIENTNHYIR